MATLPGMEYRVSTDRRSDAAMAYALFRFTFGLNIMMRGIVRIAMGLPAFQTYMLTQFKDVPVMPPAFLIPFASVLPFVETLPMGVFALPVTTLWIVGITNAVNLIDGLDGLAAGIVAIAGGASTYSTSCAMPATSVSVSMRP